MYRVNTFLLNTNTVAWLEVNVVYWSSTALYITEQTYVHGEHKDYIEIPQSTRRQCCNTVDEPVDRVDHTQGYDAGITNTPIDTVVTAVTRLIGESWLTPYTKVGILLYTVWGQAINGWNSVYSQMIKWSSSKNDSQDLLTPVAAATTASFECHPLD